MPRLGVDRLQDIVEHRAVVAGGAGDHGVGIAECTAQSKVAVAGIKDINPDATLPVDLVPRAASQILRRYRDLGAESMR